MVAPTDELPEWATTTNYPTGALDSAGNAADWAGQPRRVLTGLSALAAAGLVPEEPFDAESLNAWLGILSEWVTFFTQEAGTGIYGDGADGAITYASGTHTLTADVYATDVTVESGAVVNTAGFRIFASGHCDVQSGGTVRNNGQDGESDGSIGAGAPSGTIGGGSVGGAGGSNNSNGSSGNVQSNGLGGAGGAGGDDGDPVDTYSGGSGGTVSAPSAANGRARDLFSIITGRLTTGSLFHGGSGGGGGAANASVAIGGGGGGGGGCLLIVARRLTIDGTVQANGGDGGNAIDQPGPEIGSGGGGGGGGGRVMLVTRQRAGSGTTEAAGGTGGGGFLGGTSGDDGNAGEVIELTG